MWFGINRIRGTLSGRLTRAYAAMFALLLVTLSITVFLVAYSFFVNKQRDYLITTMELTTDHIIEKVHEGEDLTSRGVLEEQHGNSNLNLYLLDSTGTVINRVVNFRLNQAELPAGPKAPVLNFSAGDHMQLSYEQPVEDAGTVIARLYIVLNMQNEQDFLQLLGILLLGANIIGAAGALYVGWRTSRKMLSPIDSMISNAQSIGNKSLDARLDVPEAADELKRLALTINSMLARIESAFEIQGRFVADASHELRTPLAVLQGNAELLERWGREDEKVLGDSIHSIRRQSEYMNKLVENLLFLARSDTRQQTLHKERFRVCDLYCELIEEQSLIDQAHIYSMTCEPSLWLFADRCMVKELLQTLMDNSAKYSEAKGQIALSADGTAQTVSLTVCDTGVGMQEEHLTHIFDRFYRVDKARARETGGMGLGLSIAAAIVQAHNGSISAKSSAGNGTAITAVFPQHNE